MSETIDFKGDVSLEEAVSKGFPLEVIEEFKRVSEDAEIYLEYVYEGWWLTSFDTKGLIRYMPVDGVPPAKGGRVSSIARSEVMSRSHRIILQEGVMPYAYRS